MAIGLPAVRRFE